MISESSIAPADMTVEISPVGETAKVETLPSGLQYRLKLEKLNGEIYEKFQSLVAETTVGGEKPEGFLAASDWLAMQLVEVEGQPLTLDTYDALDMEDTLFLDDAIEGVMGLKTDDADELPPSAGLLPSGRNYRLNEKNFTGRIYRSFKERALRSQGGGGKGKAPSKAQQSKQALESISWLYTQLVEVDGVLLTTDTYRALDIRDAAFVSNWMGKLLDKSRLRKI